jgi:hypothetical protein
MKRGGGGGERKSSILFFTISQEESDKCHFNRVITKITKKACGIMFKQIMKDMEEHKRLKELKEKFLVKR